MAIKLHIQDIRAELLDRVDHERMATMGPRKRENDYHASRAEAFLEALQLVDAWQNGEATELRDEGAIRDEIYAR